MMLPEAQFLVAPDTGLVIWTIIALVYGPVVLSAAVVTAVKGRWTWPVIGLLTMGLLLLYSAFLPARPGSEWVRWRHRRDRRRSAG
jgi:hypothetical protein